MTIGIKNRPLGLQNAKSIVFCIIFCMHKGGGWTDLGAHGGAAGQLDLRVTSDFARKMSVCCVLATDWAEKLG